MVKTAVVSFGRNWSFTFPPVSAKGNRGWEHSLHGVQMIGGREASKFKARVEGMLVFLFLVVFRRFRGEAQQGKTTKNGNLGLGRQRKKEKDFF